MGNIQTYLSSTLPPLPFNSSFFFSSFLFSFCLSFLLFLVLTFSYFSSPLAFCTSSFLLLLLLFLLHLFLFFRRLLLFFSSSLILCFSTPLPFLPFSRSLSLFSPPPPPPSLLPLFSFSLT
jgi:hypothetical protein